MQHLHQVLIIDDHPLFRDALRSAVSKAYPTAQFKDARNVEDALVDLARNLADGKPYDLALLDLSIPGVQGFDGLLRIRKTYPRLPVIVVSGLEDSRIIQKSLGFGAAGFVPKSLGSEKLAEAVNVVMEGSVYIPDGYKSDSAGVDEDEHAELMQKLASLTPQQLRVLQMLRAGMLNKQIAAELEVGATTVKAHVSEILRKLNVYSRTQAVIEVSKLDYAGFSDSGSNTV